MPILMLAVIGAVVYLMTKEIKRSGESGVVPKFTPPTDGDYVEMG